MFWSKKYPNNGLIALNLLNFDPCFHADCKEAEILVLKMAKVGIVFDHFPLFPLIATNFMFPKNT